jgi:hypothetical protein
VVLVDADEVHGIALAEQVAPVAWDPPDRAVLGQPGSGERQ